MDGVVGEVMWCFIFSANILNGFVGDGKNLKAVLTPIFRVCKFKLVSVVSCKYIGTLLDTLVGAPEYSVSLVLND